MSVNSQSAEFGYHETMANMYLKQNLLDNAIREFKAAIAIDPTDF